MAKLISTEELALDEGQFQVVDVRRRPVFDVSPQMISGAVWKNPEEVDSWKTHLDPSRRVIMYCVHGHQVSQGCADVLEKAGFDVGYLEGGFEKWISENKPVVTRLERTEP